MERLTGKHYKAADYYMECSAHCACDSEMCGACPETERAINRLGKYEDTGLTPEEITTLAAKLRQIEEEKATAARVAEMSRPAAGLQRELEQTREELAAARADIEELIWLYGPCRFCKNSKNGGNRFWDRPCKTCEPKWRGGKGRQK